MANIFMTLRGVTVQIGGARLLDGLDWTIRRGEQWAVTGESGSGKTVLAHTLMGRHFYTGQMEFHFDASAGGASGGYRIAVVEQQHKFRSQAGATELYYQQRFNASDADKTITVAQELAEYAGWEGDVGPAATAGSPREALRQSEAGSQEQAAERASWLDSLHIRPLLNKPLIQLSNGENKRVQLAIALLEDPECLILDNPFLGLDTEGRATLHGIINRLAAEEMQILLITSSREIPDCITHIGQLEKGHWSFCGPRAGFHHSSHPTTTALLNTAILARLRQEAPDDTTAGGDFSVAVKMVDTTIKYGEAIILNHINWEVRKGERWNVSGPNGAGKSTLLSLITADNPQAYANEIWLFDRRRGTGETIWDIKRKIGFVSPELHLYFDTGANCFDVIASGLFDTIGLFRPLTAQQEETTLLWMQLLSLQELRTRRLAQLSTGQQRMVLLARALIKNPPMLILDEPSQGLDEEQTAYFRSLVTALCEALDKTLIYVSHYRQELPVCIDKFLQLEKGGLVT
jgi:molybdate transport system ATP-binding protein